MHAWKNAAYVVLMALLGVAAVAYARAMRRWTRRLRQVADAAPTPEAHAQFMASDEYRQLRQAVRKPMFVASLVLLALILLERFG